MHTFLYCLALALAICTGGNFASAQTQNNPLLLWNVFVQEAVGGPVAVTIPVPANGGTNSVGTALGTVTLTTTITTATVNLINFHAVLTQPNTALLSSQVAADCTGASTSNNPVPIKSNSAGIGFVQALNPINANCTVTGTNGTRQQTILGFGGGAGGTSGSVGTATLAQGTAVIVHHGVQFQLTPGQFVGIALNDQLITGPNSIVQTQFADQTTFTINQNSNLIIDTFFYDPSTGAGVITAKILKGIFRWVTGSIGRNRGNREVLNTPVDANGIRGTDFMVSVARSGNTINETTTVSSGIVDQTDLQGNLTTLTAGQSGHVSAPAPTLLASVLPLSRSVATTNLATAFAVVANAGRSIALGCTISAPQTLPVLFSYQTTDPATNMPTGDPNVPVDIPPGGTQTFVISLTPTAPFNATNVQLSYNCNGADDSVASLPGINSLLLSGSNTPAPDVVALAATNQNDGIIHIPGNSGSNAFAVATVNVGASSSITATANTGSASLPLALALCQTNPQSGQCLAPPTASVATTIAANATPTFAIFGNASGAIPFDPANSRIFVQFSDSAGAVRGSTSVAVETQ